MPLQQACSSHRRNAVREFIQPQFLPAAENFEYFLMSMLHAIDL